MFAKNLNEKKMEGGNLKTDCNFAN